MDVADAVNMMMWSSKDEKTGEAGVAAWDLFRAEDSPLVRFCSSLPFFAFRTAADETSYGMTMNRFDNFCMSSKRPALVSPSAK